MPIDLNGLGNLFILYGINCLGALVITLIGWWAAGMLERLTARTLTATSRMDPIVTAFLSSLVRYGVLVLVFVLILQVIGIQATSLVAVLGAASLAIGLALQGTLSNMAAGVMLLLFRPFQLGDSIEVAGKAGTVKNLNLFMTELASGDNVQVLIPNGQVWGSPITNVSAYPTRSVNVKVPVPYGGNAEAVSGAIRDFLSRDGRVLPLPAASIVLSGFTDKGVDVAVQAWAKAGDADGLKAEIVRRASAALADATVAPAS
ncbi:MULTISPECIES: mechanosensitive ion channel family protein [Labrys]|uniref:mechanosensitive ion channel family protein n=1 Tax=Labrys TaxID=204476 RepID=UPI001FD80CE0|nr:MULTISPECIES: mechanosensitive ion channel domain-containing protein [Labrys]